MANQLIVPGSASTKGNADFRNSATSFSLPGLASRGTYKASSDIVYSHIAVDMDVVHTVRISRSTARYQSQSLRRRHFFSTDFKAAALPDDLVLDQRTVGMPHDSAYRAGREAAQLGLVGRLW